MNIVAQLCVTLFGLVVERFLQKWRPCRGRVAAPQPNADLLGHVLQPTQPAIAHRHREKCDGERSTNRVEGEFFQILKFRSII